MNCSPPAKGPTRDLLTHNDLSMSFNPERRTFLQLIGAGVLGFGFADLLSGCGGGGGGGGGGQVNATAAVSVDPAFVSASQLTVVSGLGSAQVSSSKASLTVPPSQAAVLFCVDSGARVEALLVYAGDSAATSMSAASTAQALIFLTAGIATTDITTAIARLSAIASLASFGPLVSYVSQHGLAGSLNLLATDATYQGLAAQCVTDYFAAHPPQWQAAPAFAAVFQNNVNTGFTNYVPRYVAVVQEELAAAGGASLSGPNSPRSLSLTGTGTNSIGLLAGPPILAAGGLAAGLGLPSGSSAPITYDSSLQVGTLRYWAFGPGVGGNAPTGVAAAAQTDAAWFFSIYSYLLAPLASLILGSPAEAAIGNAAPAIWVAHEGDFSSAAVAASPTATGFLSLLQKVGGFVASWISAGGLSSSAQAGGQMLSWYGAFMGAFNLGAVSANWLSLPGQTNSDVSISTLTVGIS